jgi:hypothetical protein
VTIADFGDGVHEPPSDSQRSMSTCKESSSSDTESSRMILFSVGDGLERAEAIGAEGL